MFVKPAISLVPAFSSSTGDADTTAYLTEVETSEIPVSGDCSLTGMEHDSMYGSC